MNTDTFHISNFAGAMFVAENVGTVTEGDLVNLCLVTNNTVFERNSTVNLAFQPMGYSDEGLLLVFFLNFLKCLLPFFIVCR